MRGESGVKEREGGKRESMWKREKEREERGQLSILRHDSSKDTAVCCDYWGAAKKGDAGRKKESERVHEGGNRGRDKGKLMAE